VADAERIHDSLVRLGIPTLAAAFDAGSVADLVSPDQLAAYRRDVTMLIDSPVEAAELARHFLKLTARALDGPFLEVDGRRYIRGDDEAGDDGVLEVTVDSLRHGEWMYTILTDAAAGARLLEVAIPEREAWKMQMDAVWWAHRRQQS